MKLFAIFGLVLCACGGSKAPPKPTDGTELGTTLNELAMVGEKRVGTLPGQAAGAYVRQRMEMLKLDVSEESFSFPRHDVLVSTLDVQIAGTATPIKFDTFEGSGSGDANLPVAYVGTATDNEVQGLDLTGKIALVDRNKFFHRSSQYRNVIDHHAAAMIYVSAAADNLIQIGSVRRNWEPTGTIPALTIGQVDGMMLEQALKDGKAVQAHVTTQVQITSATGQNVIGKIKGSDAAGEIVIGAHYDTWFTGSSDNGGGIAALLALAKRRLERDKPRYTLTFVAYDGEEVALYGGYDFLRRHRVVTQEPILAALNFEIPQAKGSVFNGLAHSNHMPLDDSLMAAGLENVYSIYTTMDAVPMLFGGIIPTDIQGIYRSGVPTATTATDSPYYHTTQDTPDKVDTDVLAQAVDDFDDALERLMKFDPARFQTHDDQLWQATVKAAARSAGDPIHVDVTLADGVSAPLASTEVTAILLVDDFSPRKILTATTGPSGQAAFDFVATDASAGGGHRFIHVTAGPTYPLVEQILAVE